MTDSVKKALGRLVVGVVGISALVVAAAYAAVHPIEGRGGERRPLQPQLTAGPPSRSEARQARFEFRQPARPAKNALPGLPLRFLCRLDGGQWEPCTSPYEPDGLRTGRHTFDVRALNSAGSAGPAATRAWRVVLRAPVLASEAAAVSTGALQEPVPAAGAPFAVEQLSEPLDLYPGSPPQTLAVRLLNTGSEPVTVTSLAVSIAHAPPGCGSENFELVPAGITITAPLEIPPESDVQLPSPEAAAPQIAMRELPVSQDACQGGELRLAYAGTGRR
jgi:hypothetical protein